MFGKTIKIKNRDFLFFAFIILSIFVACNEYTSILCFMVFLCVSVLVFIFARNLESIAFYFLLIAINSAVGKIAIPRTTVTITALIYVFFFLLMVYEIYKGKKISPLFSLLILLWLITRIITHYINGRSIIEVCWRSIVICIGVAVFMLVQNNKKNSGFLLKCICFTGYASCLLGCVEMLLGKTFFYSRWTGQERYRFGVIRAGSFFEDPNYLSLFLVPLFFLLFTETFRKTIGMMQVNVLMALIVFCVAFSGSRSGIISLILGICLYYFLKYRKILIILVPGIFVVIYFSQFLIDDIMNADLSSTSTRLRIIEVAIEYWKKNVIWGNGINSFYNDSKSLIGTQYQTINTYVNILVDFGVVGFGYYVVLFVCEIRYAMKCFSAQYRRDSIILIVSIISWIIMAFTLDTYTTIMYLIFPAVINSMSQLSEE